MFVFEDPEPFMVVMDAFGTNHYSQPPQYTYDFEGYFGPLHVQRDSPYTSYGQGLVYSGA